MWGVKSLIDKLNVKSINSDMMNMASHLHYIQHKKGWIDQEIQDEVS